MLAGVDEVGRGPLAGPVLAAAVILDPLSYRLMLKDSKKLTEKKREALCAIIKKEAIAWAIGSASVKEIDNLNIFHATLLAMKRAVENLPIAPQHVLVDGNHCPHIAMPCEAIVGGDDKISEISAASIVAKVTRDYLMKLFDKKYPEFCFSQHKGYGTKKHLEAMAQHGITRLHRLSFSPVKKYVS